MNNIHISYTLYAPGQNYARVIDKIKTLGSWARVHESFWYIKTNMSSSEIAEAVWAAMDRNDSLYVVDATNDTAAWYNLPADVSTHLKEKWHGSSLSR